MIATVETLTPDGPPSARPRRRVWRIVLLVLLVLILVFVVVANFVKMSEIAIVPGSAESVSPFLNVPSDQAHPMHGSILLTDVDEVDVTLLNWIWFHFDSNAQVYPEQQVTGGFPEQEAINQGFVDMHESQLTAAAMALRQLGYSAPEHDAGAVIYIIQPNTPAAASLQVGHVITAIDGHAVRNADDLQQTLRQDRPGQTVAIRAYPLGQNGDTTTVDVKLSSHTVNGVVVPYVGVGVFTQPAWDLPVAVSVSVPNIGGPSAGLALTLGLINSLSGGNLTDGMTIAATGTIRPDGTVGDVGGVAQKTVAVSSAGATVFLVPDVEVATAKAHAGAHLRIFGVTSLAQALKDLQSLGGKLGRAATGPPSGPGGHSVPTGWQGYPWR